MSGAWSFNNVNLDTYGIVETISGFYDFPGRRGDNIVIPFSDGETYVDKYLNKRVVIIGIAMVGDTIADMESSLDALKLAMNIQGLYNLSVVMASGTTRIGQAEIKDPILVVRLAPDSIRAIIRFTLPDPYFYVSGSNYI